ncbi:hypothetical protein BP6252_02306 [Coleophoma cylindrospora]|uniref:Uncharacterized protein n=1 Tax=Coleophoma cylindrospora TaxID=1849047 RepID=A0A3D8SEI9_9HELO|nr:hypothetical protein BP6252_02306 [Coleophoma cylindrospora]
MPSPKPADEETTPTRPKANNPTTPRRASAVKRTPNGTPVRKGPATPNSAPVRARTGAKKAEPTLLTDFLLGRPSPSRTRRKSLDVVKAEIRQEMVKKVQPPGGVQDRVKKWQKASAAAVIEDPAAASDVGEEIVVEVEEDSEDEHDRIKIKTNEAKPGRPGRRKDQVEEHEERKARSKSAPRKRVVSDSHWMKKDAAQGKKPALNGGGATLPKDFLKKTAVNPPFKSKIEDWAKRIETESMVDEPLEPIRPVRKKSKYTLPDDGIRVFPAKKNSLGDDETRAKPSRDTTPDDGIRVKPIRKQSNGDGLRAKAKDDKVTNDGIRVTPTRDTSGQDDGIRVKPLQDKFADDGIRVGPSPDNGDDQIHSTPSRKSKRASGPENMGRNRSHRKSSAHVGDESVHQDSGSESDISYMDDVQTSQTPSRSHRSKRHSRKSGSPAETLEEIPFGNSAFSVLDLPLGAEAGNQKRSKPQRTTSLSAVPKVLRKVYNEGKKMVQDNAEPPRPGFNQPPSIESWLNGTTDPFVDRPQRPNSTLGIPESSSRRESFNPDDPAERELTAKPDDERSGSQRRKQHARTDKVNEDEPSSKDGESPSTPIEANIDHRKDLPGMRSPSSPNALKRSPATRTISTPVKTARKLPFKDILKEAFTGESVTTYQPKHGPSILVNNFERSNDINKFADSYEDDTRQRTEPPPPKPPAHRTPKGSPPEKPNYGFGRRLPPTTGEHRLSTIASIETFSSLSSVTETESNISKTTVTQATTNSGGPSDLSRRRSSRSGPKRRLTKHSDLISMLSLPDTAAPGRAKSIRSARSVRTSRSHLETATIRDLLRELSDDETKYMRELKTLVDGVVPVLLTCVLSKSESAIAAGLFNPDSTDPADTSFTKPIVAMGIALERLKSLHKRIPLQDAEALVIWAHRAHKVYDDYLAAWRLGFQDVVVNLAPASRTSSAEQKSLLEEIPQNASGDVVNSNGERVDVAFLLKRPLVRIKYLAKLTKGLNNLRPTEQAAMTQALYEDLHLKVRRRQKEEAARLEDQAANNTDVTRARDPRTLAQVEDARIDRTRQVSAKDVFSLDLKHSNGQRIECQVELVMRDKPADPVDAGDILICQVDSFSRFLLFPPISKDFVSARPGEESGQVVIMIRGNHESKEWYELLVLETDDQETASEWLQMLGQIPFPPTIVRNDEDRTQVQPLPPPQAPTDLSLVEDKSCPSSPDPVEIPIGQRRRVSREAANSPNPDSRRNTPSQLRSMSSITEESLASSLSELSATKRPRAARYHARTGSTSPITPRAQSPSMPSTPVNRTPKQTHDTSSPRSPETVRASSPGFTADLPFIPKIRKSPSPATPTAPETPKLNSPLRDLTIAEPDLPEKQPPKSSSPEAPLRDDGAPPPPKHSSPSSGKLKSSPILECTTPRSTNRRTSSPLKHEYQPSEGSETSSESSDSEDDESFTESSDEDEELEAADLPAPLPSVGIYTKRQSPNGSFYSLQNTSLAPSNSASQGPYRSVPSPIDPAKSKKIIAMISSWSDKKGRWEDLHHEPCSIVVSAGLIEAFEMSASHSKQHRADPMFESADSEINDNVDAGAERPLVALVLTPLVSLRQSTALDIEIKSPPTARSKLKCSGTVRYRALNVIACQELYTAIHRARLENPVYKKLEQERMLNSYGGQSYEAAVASNRRRTWFGRQRSYRASTRAPSQAVSNGSDNSHSSSAFSALKRLSGGSIFNIARSSVDTGMHPGPTSMYTTSSDSASGVTTPRTPTSPSLSGTATSNAVNLGNENLKIRLYCLETSSKWNDIGAARLTVTQPPPGMRQASSLYHGIEKRVIVTRKALDSDKKKGQDGPVVLLDVVLGSGCFSKIGRTGIAVNVWEDVMGDNGEVGTVGAVGGVSGRTRKWMLQCGSAVEANWIFGLVAVGR